MTQIPDSLHSLFAATVNETNGTYTIEIPTSELDHGAINPNEVYTVAVLDSSAESPASGSRSRSSTEDDPDKQVSSGPPVAVGELRTVTIEAVGDQGDGIAKVDSGYVVIVPEARTGEQPTVRVDKVRPNVAFASVVEPDPRTL